MPTVISGTTGINKVQDSVVTDTKLALTANSQGVKDALNASGTAPIYACRAWVNFNGTGTVAMRASGNVSSITDNGVGDYTVNLTTAMPDTNYETNVSSPSILNTNASTASYAIGATTGVGGYLLKSTTQLRVGHSGLINPAVYYDVENINVAIFR